MGTKDRNRLYFGHGGQRVPLTSSTVKFRSARCNGSLHKSSAKYHKHTCLSVARAYIKFTFTCGVQRFCTRLKFPISYLIDYRDTGSGPNFPTFTNLLSLCKLADGWLADLIVAILLESFRSRAGHLIAIYASVTIYFLCLHLQIYCHCVNLQMCGWLIGL